MQPYHQVKPHDLNSCRACGPRSPGHQACQHDGCDEVAEVQYRRHATDEEYAAIPEGLLPLDQVAHVAVFTCGDHEPGPVCGPGDHPGPPEDLDLLGSACPKCSAGPGAMCVKADGQPRRIAHKSRVPALPPPAASRCDHVHRAACEGLGACQCSPGDLIPQRMLPPEAGRR